MKQFSSLAAHSSRVTGSTQPTHEEIARRAEALWRGQGTPDDRDDEIWREAERQLQREAKATTDTDGADGARRAKSPL